MYRQWPFFTTLLDNAQQSLAETDMYIAGRYASLVESDAVREKIFGMIHDEYERWRATLAAIAAGAPS